ncbi:MAG: GNAT family N-acetyltransferase [Acidimicrobiia bacterium]|nr:MAG: GNAT family N-acetyltransferase [Acidimicrobiia bacterium]
MQHLDSQFAGHRISSDPDLVDIGVVHDYLSNHSYWAAGRSRDVVATSIAHSALVVGAYTQDGSQVGFARMVSDLATFAWLADVFVLEAHRGRGLGRAIVKFAVEHPDMVKLQRQVLATADAHSLYADFGFVPLEQSERWMVRPGGSPSS